VLVMRCSCCCRGRRRGLHSDSDGCGAARRGVLPGQSAGNGSTRPSCAAAPFARPFGGCAGGDGSVTRQGHQLHTRRRSGISTRRLLQAVGSEAQRGNRDGGTRAGVGGSDGGVCPRGLASCGATHAALRKRSQIRLDGRGAQRRGRGGQQRGRRRGRVAARRRGGRGRGPGARRGGGGGGQRRGGGRGRRRGRRSLHRRRPPVAGARRRRRQGWRRRGRQALHAPPQRCRWRPRRRRSRRRLAQALYPGRWGGGGGGRGPECRAGAARLRRGRAGGARCARLPGPARRQHRSEGARKARQVYGQVGESG